MPAPVARLTLCTWAPLPRRPSGDLIFSDSWSRFCRQVAAPLITSPETLARAPENGEGPRPHANFTRGHAAPVAPLPLGLVAHNTTGVTSRNCDGLSRIDDRSNCFEALDLSRDERGERTVALETPTIQTGNAGLPASSLSVSNKVLKSLSSSHPFSVYQLTKPSSVASIKTQDPVVVSQAASSLHTSYDGTNAVAFNLHSKALFKSPTRKRHSIVNKPSEDPSLSIGSLLKCSQCSYSTQHRSAMTSHTRTHTGEKPYVCQYCPYRSSQSGNLMTHLKTHTGEKPFACDQCAYKSSQRIHLERHMLTHLMKK